MMQAAVLKPERFIPKPKGNPRSATSLQQLVAIQAKVHAKAMHPKTTSKLLCMLSRAFVELERLRRDMRGIPNPKDVDVASLASLRGLKKLRVPFTDPHERAQPAIEASAQPKAKQEHPRKNIAAQPEASTDCACISQESAPREDQDARAKTPAEGEAPKGIS